MNHLFQSVTPLQGSHCSLPQSYMQCKHAARTAHFSPASFPATILRYIITINYGCNAGWEAERKWRLSIHLALVNFLPLLPVHDHPSKRTILCPTCLMHENESAGPFFSHLFSCFLSSPPKEKNRSQDTKRPLGCVFFLSCLTWVLFISALRKPPVPTPTHHFRQSTLLTVTACCALCCIPECRVCCWNEPRTKGSVLILMHAGAVLYATDPPTERWRICDILPTLWNYTQLHISNINTPNLFCCPLWSRSICREACWWRRV